MQQGRGAPDPELRTASATTTENQVADDLDETSDPLDAANSDDVVVRINRLHQRGRFEEFIDAAIIAAEEEPERTDLQLLRVDALLAAGRNADAAQTAARGLQQAVEQDNRPLAADALRLWMTSRFRLGQSLADPQVAAATATLTDDDSAVGLYRFWREALAEDPPFHVSDPPAEPASLELAPSSPRSIPHELAAIQATAGGVRLERVFIDTGTQHTLMTFAAAQAAGVRLGESATQLTGFVALTAQPGLIETLELGPLVLHNVPVLVADSPPLVELAGQMSLGTELMHHVRFEIDYSGHRVTASPAGQSPSLSGGEPFWRIPLWTFSRVCLARAELPDGTLARLLVDTGDRAGTFVSYRWARRHLPQLQGSNSSLVFRFKKRNLAFDRLDVGSQSLVDWPIVDTIPKELDRMNLVDVMLGHDLLWAYRLTIDLPSRVLQLHAGTSPTADRAREHQRRP